MKKILPIIIIGILLIGGISVNATKNENISQKTDKLFFNQPKINNVEDEILIDFENSNSWLKTTGNPMIPCYTKTYIFPFGTKIKNVKATYSEEMQYNLENKIILSPNPTTYINGKKLIYNQQIKDINSYIYPENKIEYNIYSGIIEGKRSIILNIKCFPIQYISSENKILFSENFDITISYEKSDITTINNEEFDMVIIAPEIFSSEIQPLIDHKDTFGIKTFLKTTQDIYSEFSGVDEAEKIKYFIKYAIETYNISYVLLFGGRNGQRFQWHVPVRDSNLDDDSDFETRFVSDLYYSDIYDGGGNFSSWDPDGNGVFAEWNDENKDILDLVPDIYLGRLPCRNKFEVKIMVNKIIKYETTAYGSEWFNDMVVVGGDSAPDDIYYEGEEENAQALEYMQDFNGIKLWTSDGSFTGPDDVINAISNGCGFLFFDGHGNPSSWSTHPPEDKKTWITGLQNSDMRKLKNGEKLPVAVVGACHNGQFEVTILNILKGVMEEGLEFFSLKFYYMEWVHECWAWRMARKIGGGSIAIMAYSGLDWFATGDYDSDGIPDCVQYFSGFCNTNFFKNYAVNNNSILGQAHTQTLIDYVNAFPPMDEKLDCKTVQEFTLLGDPSLQIGGYP